MTTKTELDKQLDALEASLPAMIAEYPDQGDFWMAFAGEADCIQDATPSKLCKHFHKRIEEMLAKHDRYLLVEEDSGR